MFLILPNQLYLNPPCKSITIWEHPHYFSKYKYNKKKLILHRSSMKYMEKTLKRKGRKVKYVNFNRKPNIKNYSLYDPIDKIELPGSPIFLENPGFLLNTMFLEKYRKSTTKFFFHNFYRKAKTELKVMEDVKSQDKHNRKLVPSGKLVPKGVKPATSEKKYIDEAVKYVKKYFPHNYGNCENFIFPISHKNANKWVKDFIKNKLKYFGDYQDYISKDENFLFHSLLSSSINTGLINVKKLLKVVLKNAKSPLNSREGFLRQLIWREYQRYCFIYTDFSKNYLGNSEKLDDRWYTGNTGVKPVDHCIVKGFETGYLHHIERLMVIGNFMNLTEIHPKEGFRWFMEFSCDSYEWVMHQNVYDMVFFSTGGKTMRRPYISSSNYILKMSNYKKDKWSDKWDDLYKKFVKKNKDKLYKFRYYVKI